MDICPFRVSVRMNSQITGITGKMSREKEKGKKEEKEIRWNIKTRVHLSRKFIRQPAHVSIFPLFLWKTEIKRPVRYTTAQRNPTFPVSNNGEEGSFYAYIPGFLTRWSRSSGEISNLHRSPCGWYCLFNDRNTRERSILCLGTVEESAKSRASGKLDGYLYGTVYKSSSMVSRRRYFSCANNVR